MSRPERTIDGREKEDVMRWAEFESSAPELATLAKDRFAATELIMLGTLRKDGWPRISPCEYAIWEGDFMVGGIWQSKKCLDLIRDPRCTIHNATSDKNGRGGDVKVYARARRLGPGGWNRTGKPATGTSSGRRCTSGRKKRTCSRWTSNRPATRYSKGTAPCAGSPGRATSGAASGPCERYLGSRHMSQTGGPPFGTWKRSVTLNPLRS
jgi:hypothetical protein